MNGGTRKLQNLYRLIWVAIIVAFISLLFKAYVPDAMHYSNWIGPAWMVDFSRGLTGLLSLLVISVIAYSGLYRQYHHMPRALSVLLIVLIVTEGILGIESMIQRMGILTTTAPMVCSLGVLTLLWLMALYIKECMGHELPNIDKFQDSIKALYSCCLYGPNNDCSQSDH